MAFTQAADTVNDRYNSLESTPEPQRSCSPQSSSPTRYSHKRRCVDGNDDDYCNGYGHGDFWGHDLMSGNQFSPIEGSRRSSNLKVSDDNAVDLENGDADDADLMVCYCVSSCMMDKRR